MVNDFDLNNINKDISKLEFYIIYNHLFLSANLYNKLKETFFSMNSDIQKISLKYEDLIINHPHKLSKNEYERIKIKINYIQNKINNIDKYCSHIIKFRSQEAIELLTIVTIILWPVSIFFSYFAINFNSLPNMKPLNISNITLILFILTFIGILVMCLRDTNIIYYLKIFIYNIDTDTKKIPIKINKINKKWNKSK